MDAPPAPKVTGVFDPGDLVRIHGQSARLWHVLLVDPDRDPESGTVRIRPDCSCGGPTWVSPEMIYHSE